MRSALLKVVGVLMTLSLLLSACGGAATTTPAAPCCAGAGGNIRSCGNGSAGCGDRRCRRRSGRPLRRDHRAKVNFEAMTDYAGEVKISEDPTVIGYMPLPGEC
jgi:hypothetical protein